MKKIFSVLLVLMMLSSLIIVSSASGYVSRDGWYVKASSVHTNTNWLPERVIDGKEETYYHSNYGADGTPTDTPPITLTFTLPYVTTVSGFAYTPRNDGNTTGIVTGYNIYVSDKDTGKARLIKSGEMACDASIKEIKFGFSVDVKTVVFEMTEGQYNYVTCAEFNLLDASGSKRKIEDVAKGKTFDLGGVDESDRTPELSRDGWKVTASSVHSNSNWLPERTLDGNVDTYWHSDYDSEGNPVDAAPYTLTYTLPKAVSASAFSYVPRKDNSTGRVTEFKLYAQDADAGEARLIASGSMDGTGVTQYIDFGVNVTVKKVIFEIEKGMWGMGSCAEFYLHEARKTYENKVPADISKSVFGKEDVQADGEKIKDKSKWKVTATSAKAHYPATNAIDGDANTIWHSNYEDDGFGTITSVVKGPHSLEITFPSAKIISGFGYVPRESPTGRILEYEFYVADSDAGEWFLADNGSFDNNDSEKKVDFLANIKAKKVMLKTVKTVGEYGVAAEVDIYSENPEYQLKTDYNEFKTYYDDNRLVKITNNNGELYAEGSSVWREGNEGAMTVDGNINSAWHSSPDDKNKYPFTLDVDLGKEHSVVEFVYYARTDAEGKRNGLWTKFNIWAGNDPEKLSLVKENASFENISEPQKLVFDKPVRARYYSFEITEGVNGYATCCELAFYEKFKTQSEEKQDEVSYMLTIGSNVLKTVTNGVTKEKTMDVAPYIDGGYTQIPLRGLLEEMGATFDWDGEYNRITVKTDATTIVLQIYNNLVTVTNRTYGEVCYTLHSVPHIKDSRTFVPLRFISENLGYKVDWDDATKTVTVTK